MEQTFTGNVNDVWLSINKFFGEMIPAFEIARKVTLTVDLSKLIDDFKNVIAIAPEGPELLVPRENFTDSETLQLQLLAKYIGCQVGKSAKDFMTREELAAKLGKNMKITTTRLGELVKNGYVAKTNDGNYRITTLGITQAQKEILKKMRSRI
jgi:hypothetical protein